VAKKSGFFSTFPVHPCLSMPFCDLIPVILEPLLKPFHEGQERSKRVRALHLLQAEGVTKKEEEPKMG
jgi:hypothetical protein